MHEENDDIPWASPEIQINYEASLGKFILAFNRLEALINQIISHALNNLNRTDLIEELIKKSDFNLRLKYFDLLQYSRNNSPLETVDLKKIKGMAQHRNNLAHGHFDQNPFDGSYNIQTRRKDFDNYSIERINSLANEIDEVCDELDVIEVSFQFQHINENLS